MQALLLNEETQAEVRRVLDFAVKPENYYVVGGTSSQRPVGDDPRYVAHIHHGFRAVFSVTKVVPEDGRLYRHLTVSVDSGKLPAPTAAFTIASLFGFPGWDIAKWNGKDEQLAPKGWRLGIRDREIPQHIILCVPYENTDSRPQEQNQGVG